MAGQLRFKTPYLNDYMAMVEDTESPRIFHLWSALFGISCSLGRRCFLPFGTGEILPNQYVLFVGTPGTRKSTAMKIGEKRIKKNTGVRFAPSDTGFQRQGLAQAMAGNPEQDQDKAILNAQALAEESIGLHSLMNICVPDDDSEEANEAHEIAKADKHHMAIVANEFSRVIGQNNLSMMDFLGERYDGDSYEYKTLKSHIKMDKTLVNMMACTTPTSIANALPPAAGGQGFLSRVILVYGAKKYRKIPRPKAFDDTLVSQVDYVIREIYTGMNGAFSESRSAVALSEDLYDYQIEIADSRFGYYAERRYTHLLKLGMAIAAANGRMTIQPEDYEEAHKILKATERGMPDALGEFGMNKLAALKQEILEQLRASQGPLTMEQIVAMFHRDARSNEISEVIMDLINAKQVILSQLPDGKRLLTAKLTRQSTEDEMMNLLSER